MCSGNVCVCVGGGGGGEVVAERLYVKLLKTCSEERLSRETCV